MEPTAEPVQEPTAEPTVESTAEPVQESDDTESASASDPALIDAGRAAYLGNYCGTCHRLAEAGTAGVFGPAHDGMGTIAAARIADPDYDGAATDAAGYIRESIVDPYAYFVPTFGASPHRMPPYAHLDAELVDAMVAYLLAQQ